MINCNVLYQFFDKKGAIEMLPFYLVGEPWLFGVVDKREFYAPISQVALCRRVLKEVEDRSFVLQKLREEYLAIIWTLNRMKIEFRIIYSHEDEIDKEVIATCVNALGCRLVGFPPTYFPPGIVYPRDFATVLPGLVLVNSNMVKVMVGQKEGCRILSSPYGEGGRTLFCNNTMLVCERLVLEDRQSVDAEKNGAIDEIRKMDIRIGLLPPPLARSFSASEDDDKAFFNDHLDRVACLIKGANGKLHLVVDPKLCTADWRSAQGTPWTPRLTTETMQRVKQICEPLGIEVHSPKDMRIPYALNLIQFEDGRVLMTDGDESVAEVISEIVGGKNVFKTPTPIRFFPAWCYAGIRCLVNEAPVVLFKSI